MWSEWILALQVGLGLLSEPWGYPTGKYVYVGLLTKAGWICCHTKLKGDKIKAECNRDAETRLKIPGRGSHPDRRAIRPQMARTRYDKVKPPN